MPVLLLTTRGRRSGRLHTVPLGYFDCAGVRFVVASNGGAPGDPAWYLNLTVHPEVQVEVGRESYAAIAMPAMGEQRAQLWDYLMATARFYRRLMATVRVYRRSQHSARQIPLVVLHRIA
jgi:deazaflavin-dependent oxidoreductase (nitroreductase family)